MAHLITTTEKCGKRTAAVYGAPAAATAPWRVFRDQFTALVVQGAGRLRAFERLEAGPSYVFSVGFTLVAAAILAAVEGGILPPVHEVRNGTDFSNHTTIPPGKMPGSTAGKMRKMPAATLNAYGPSDSRGPVGVSRCARFTRGFDSGFDLPVDVNRVFS